MSLSISKLSTGQGLIRRFLGHPDTKLYGTVFALNVPMTVLKTVMHGQAYKNEGFSPQEQKLLLVQEYVRQSVSTVLWLLSLVASVFATKKLFPKLAEKPLANALISNFISTIPDTFVRPFLTAHIVKRLMPHAAQIETTGGSEKRRPAIYFRSAPPFQPYGPVNPMLRQWAAAPAFGAPNPWQTQGHLV